MVLFFMCLFGVLIVSYRIEVSLVSNDSSASVQDQKSKAPTFINEEFVDHQTKKKK